MAKQETQAPAPEPVIVARVNAVFGDMRHLFTNKIITTSGDTKLEIDAWVQSQIDAGKLVLVKD